MLSSIRTRMLVTLAVLAILAAGVAVWMGLASAHAALEREAFRKLIAVRELKAGQIRSYFQSFRQQLLTLADDPATSAALRDFRTACAQEGVAPDDAQNLSMRVYYSREFLPRVQSAGFNVDNPSAYWPRDAVQARLQQAYLVDSPFQTGKKHLLDSAGTDSAYDRAHRRRHPGYRRLLERFGYYDLFLIEPVEGRIVYSVYKEVDFASSLDSGPYRKSGLATAYREAKLLKGGDEAIVVDFEPYLPSYGAPASFIAAPVREGNALIGVVAIQAPIDQIDDIMTSGRAWAEVGLGDSGESYLVGEDYTLRSQSRFLIEDRDEYLRSIRELGISSERANRIATYGSSVGLQEVRTEGTRAALSRRSGTDSYDDYRGVPVLGAYAPLEIEGLRWAVLAEIDAEEAFRPAARLQSRALELLAVIAVVSLLVATLLARSLTHPLRNLSQATARLARGELEADVPTGRSDEIGELARSIDVMRQSIREQLERQAREIEALSTPFIPLGQGLVVMPLVGEIDASRVKRLRESLVEGLHESSARVALLDLTGVSRLDPEHAPDLVRAAHASRLVGARVVLTGLQPHLATPLADLDLNLDGLDTARTLREGIDRAFELLGAQADDRNPASKESTR